VTEGAPPLALTMGEPGGVGPQITEIAWRTLRESGPAFFVIADPRLFASVETKVIAHPADASGLFQSALPVLPLDETVNAKTGHASQATAGAVINSIERATALALAGEAAGVVTNPIQKSALMAAGFSFPGHTEFLEHLTAEAEMPAAARHRSAIMMLAGPDLRTVPVTVHKSVTDAIKALRPTLIVKTGLIVADALRRDFAIAEPRLALSGLNPHAGEDGALGMEDQLIIAPAIDELQALGVNATGPAPADTMFHAEARTNYDAALCMLHDQALIPAKTLAFHEAVNVTLGLPIIRTSPDHGTALQIAGTDRVRADSLIAAIRLADRLAQGRRRT